MSAPSQLPPEETLKDIAVQYACQQLEKLQEAQRKAMMDLYYTQRRIFSSERNALIRRFHLHGQRRQMIPKFRWGEELRQELPSESEDDDEEEAAYLDSLEGEKAQTPRRSLAETAVPAVSATAVAASPVQPTGEHTCYVCSKKFSRKANLMRHLAKHVDYTPSACQRCGSKQGCVCKERPAAPSTQPPGAVPATTAVNAPASQLPMMQFAPAPAAPLPFLLPMLSPVPPPLLYQPTVLQQAPGSSAATPHQ